MKMLAALVIVCAAIAGEVPVVNGTFQDRFDGWTAWHYWPESWSPMILQEGPYVRVPGLNHAVGNRYVYLPASSGVYQVVSLPAPGWYTVSFDTRLATVCQWPDDPDGYWYGGLLAVYVNSVYDAFADRIGYVDNSNATGSWRSYSFDFYADRPGGWVIQFTEPFAYHNGSCLDNVTVTY